MKLVRKIRRTVRQNFAWVFCFELLYRFVCLSFFLQLTDRGLRLALKASGYSYLTAGNLGGFLLKPCTLLFLAAAGLSGLFFLTVEIGALLTAYQGAAYSRKVLPCEMLLGGLQKTADECRKRNWKLFLVILGDCVLLNLFLIYRLFSHVKPVNFVMYELFHTAFGKPLAAAVVLALALCLAPCAFVIHFSMIEQKSFGDSFWNSRRLLKSRPGQVIGVFLAGNLLLVLLLILVYFLVMTVCAVAVVLFVKKSLQMAVLFGMAGRVEAVALFLFSVLIQIGNMGIFTVFYYQDQVPVLFQEEGPGKGGKRSLGSGEKKRLAAAAAVALGISGLSMFDLVYNGSVAGSDALTVQITAHRGSSKSAPENTMAAVEAAVEEMADFAEIDVQESADGRVVVCHDLNLKRVAGLDRKVKDLTAEELKHVDVGQGNGVPELEEVMEYAKGRINLNIELKNIGDDTDLPEKVTAMVEEMGMEAQCVITSVKMKYLERVKAANPDIRTGYIVAAAYGNYFANENVDLISIRSSFVNKALTERVHEAGKAVHVWTVNSKAELEQMKQAGVDNIITDYPVRAREICCREEATETLLEYLQMVLR